MSLVGGALGPPQRSGRGFWYTCLEFVLGVHELAFFPGLVVAHGVSVAPYC